jgi:hypothetical protein
MSLTAHLGSGEALAQPSPHIIVDERVKTSHRLIASQQPCADQG